MGEGKMKCVKEKKGRGCEYDNKERGKRWMGWGEENEEE